MFSVLTTLFIYIYIFIYLFLFNDVMDILFLEKFLLEKTQWQLTWINLSQVLIPQSHQSGPWQNQVKHKTRSNSSGSQKYLHNAFLFLWQAFYLNA